MRAYHFNKLLLSTFNVSRFRNIAMTSASPTAASAAATTRTKNTKIWPLIWPLRLENATNVRLTAFSMISTDKQQRDDVSLEKESQHSQKEQRGAKNEIPVQRNHKSFFAKTTAPISAIRIRSDVSSNGSR